MSNTERTWTQDLPQTDAQLFVGASEFKDTSSNSTYGSAAAGLFTLDQAISKASTYFVNLNQILRTGVFAKGPIAGGGEQAFGTTGPPPVPGPSSVANTSGPRGIVVVPPFAAAKVPTVAGPFTGPIPKGIEIQWIDVIYTALTANLTLATFGLTQTQFLDSVAPTVANIVALGANGLSLVFQTTPHRIRITPATIAFVTLDGTEIIANVNLTTSGTGTSHFYGCVFGLGYNYN